jgi:hypothetical protein
MRNFTTIRKFEGSIPDEVIPFSNFNRTVAKGSTQPLTEMNTRNLSGGVKGSPMHKTDNLTVICELIM